MITSQHPIPAPDQKGFLSVSNLDNDNVPKTGQRQGSWKESNAVLSLCYSSPFCPIKYFEKQTNKQTLNPHESWKDSKVNISNNFTELHKLLATWCIRSYLPVCLYIYLIYLFMYLYLSIYLSIILGFPDDEVVKKKNLPANPGDERNMDSTPGFGNGNLLQYLCLKNSMKCR